MDTQLERRAAVDRRNYSFNTLKQCAVAPRRMHGRRQGDRSYALMDQFDSGIVTLAIALMILSIMDAVFTLTLISRGGSEVNPFMNALLQHSVWAFTGFKMILTGIPAIILVAVGNMLLFKKYRARSILAALVGVYLGLIVYHLALLHISS